MVAPLDHLLGADPGEARRDAATWFDRHAGTRPIVLMGSGNLGRRTLAGLRARGIEPLAFADNSTARQGTTIDGLTVLSPAHAAQKHGTSAAFVVTIWGAGSVHRYAHSERQMRDLGCDVVVPFAPLYWKYPETFLPHYLVDLPWKPLEHGDEIRRAFALMATDASRREFVSQLAFRMIPAWNGLSHPVAHPQYFPDDLVHWRPDEWVVDGGAYDGDSLRAWSYLHGAQFGAWLAVEPDPANATAFEKTSATLPADARSRVRIERVALGATRGTTTIDASGTAASATGATGPGAVPVPIVPLDELVRDAPVSFIKLDIEGGELDALAGMRRTVRANAPVLAICAYHRQDHLWRVPLLIHELLPDCEFHLRPHNEEGWDLVCYAIPPGRRA